MALAPILLVKVLVVVLETLDALSEEFNTVLKFKRVLVPVPVVLRLLAVMQISEIKFWHTFHVNGRVVAGPGLICNDFPYVDLCSIGDLDLKVFSPLQFDFLFGDWASHQIYFLVCNALLSCRHTEACLSHYRTLLCVKLACLSHGCFVVLALSDVA